MQLCVYNVSTVSWIGKLAPYAIATPLFLFNIIARSIKCSFVTYPVRWKYWCRLIFHVYFMRTFFVQNLTSVCTHPCTHLQEMPAYATDLLEKGRYYLKTSWQEKSRSRSEMSVWMVLSCQLSWRYVFCKNKFMHKPNVT